MGGAMDRAPRVQERLGINADARHRERAVLALVGGGQTNRAIAQRLVLTTRTVDSHLHNSARKLCA
jgi:DNA-binding NarL/FixJ family response regulator